MMNSDEHTYQHQTLLLARLVLRGGIGPSAQRSSGVRSTSELHGAYGEGSGSRTRIIRWTGGCNEPLYDAPIWWTRQELNLRPPAYQAGALSC